ncbi:unnamed protein product, partial [Amoebophrya sp. A25]
LELLAFNEKDEADLSKYSHIIYGGVANGEQCADWRHTERARAAVLAALKAEAA